MIEQELIEVIDSRIENLNAKHKYITNDLDMFNAMRGLIESLKPTLEMSSPPKDLSKISHCTLRNGSSGAQYELTNYQVKILADMVNEYLKGFSEKASS